MPLSSNVPFMIVRSTAASDYKYHLWNSGLGFAILTGHIHILIDNFFFDEEVRNEVESTYEEEGYNVSSGPNKLFYFLINDCSTMYYSELDSGLWDTSNSIVQQRNWQQWSSGLSNLIIVDTSKHTIEKVLSFYPLHPTFHSNEYPIVYKRRTAR